MQITPEPIVHVMRPQPGPQEQACACSADIMFYGGAAGSGKSWYNVFDASRWVAIPGYDAIIFRRESTEIRGGGGVWDESYKLYPALGGTPREHLLEWRFPSGARIEFSHLQYEKDKLSHQSKGYATIYFDELTHFTASQFWYLVSRSRSICGIRPYLRGTCNPDPDSFVAKMIAWWIGPDGFPIPERSGVIRWFVRNPDTDEIDWADTREELLERHPDAQPMSFTFIAAKLSDNPAMTLKDPGYRTKLMNLPRVERERLLAGNWYIRPAAGMYYQRAWLEVVDVAPARLLGVVRAWDKAGTEKVPGNEPAATAGVKMGKDRDGVLWILDVVRFQASPLGNEKGIKAVASQDGKRVEIAIWQDPGQAGKSDVDHYVRNVLQGYSVHGEPAREDKITYTEPLSAQAERGNVKLLRGAWNDAFIAEAEAFPLGKHKDQVDAASLAFLRLEKRRHYAGMIELNPDRGHTGRKYDI